jgi:hypothetical protein
MEDNISTKFVYFSWYAHKRGKKWYNNSIDS